MTYRTFNEPQTTITIKDITGTKKELEVILEDTSIANYKLIVTNDGKATPVGVVESRRIVYLGDRVKVSGDSRGYICPGIYRSGLGTIVGIRRDDTDHFFEILMDNGERGTAKGARITVIY